MNNNKISFSARILRIILAIVILSTLILIIGILVKQIKSTNQDTLISGITKILKFANLPVQKETVQQVAGAFIDRISDSNISSISTSRQDENGLLKDQDSIKTAMTKNNEIDDNNVKLKIGIISDVHQDLASLSNSLFILKNKNINFVIIIGDLTNYGDLSSLLEVQRVLNESGLTYYVLPGDHDLAQSVGPTNFIQVFKDGHYKVSLENINFVFLDNSANFTPILPSTISWFNDIINDVDFLILSQPIFTDSLNLPFQKMFMGSTVTQPDPNFLENQQRVRRQRDEIIKKVRDSSVKAVIAGDHHKSSVAIDPVNSKLTHHTLGSISTELNGLPQRLIQTPRFSILNIYSDDSYNIEDLILQ